MNLVLGNVAKPPGPDCFQAMSKDADKDEQKVFPWEHTALNTNAIDSF